MVISLTLMILLLTSYFVYEKVLNFDSQIMCWSLLLANTPYLMVVGLFVCMTSVAHKRFFYINCLLEQFAYQNFNDELYFHSRRQKYVNFQRNLTHVPTISIKEIGKFGNDGVKTSGGRFISQKTIDKDINRILKNVNKKDSMILGTWRKICRDFTTMLVVFNLLSLECFYQKYFSVKLLHIKSPT